MLGHYDINFHRGRALHYRIKILDLEPQQHAVSERPVVPVANRNMVVMNVETVQLKNQLATRDQLLIFPPAVIPGAAEQSLIPPATRFNISHGDQGLRAHHLNLSNKASRDRFDR